MELVERLAEYARREQQTHPKVQFLPLYPLNRKRIGLCLELPLAPASR